jgi:hypothetical protein
MNIIVIMNGQDVTDSCLLSATRIAFDSSRRITTASITVMGQALATTGARFDAANYDVDRFAVSLNDMYEVQILDGRDGVTKLFDGQIYAMTMAQSDGVSFSVYYNCELNDWAAWLDRSVCWDTGFLLTLPNSDQGIIQALLGHFCPKIHLTDIAQIVPVIQQFDWATKTCRQVLDDLSSLSMGNWRVDFDANLHYELAAAAPAAPFDISTSPDFVTSFPARVDGYRHDFTNPINHAYVRGPVDAISGVAIAADYADPVSIQTYGEYASGVVDDQIVTGWDAALRAKSIVLANAYPIESGNFTIWGKDGLACGMQIHIREENIGISGNYTIRALTMQWVDKTNVVYTAQFGAAQPDLETILRLLDQRTKWKTSYVPVSVSTPGPPPTGSVSDASIVAGGLSAAVINSVNAGTIQGKIQAGQIQTVNADTIIGKVQADQIQGVNAGSIVGQIQADQIYKVDAGSIQGSIQAGQIGSVNAGTINGVIIGSQLADQIIDNLAKYADAIRPIQMIKIGDPWPPSMPNKNFPPNSFFYFQPDGHFYQVTADGAFWVMNDNPKGSLMSFYYIGAISAQSITGLILAGQIGSITAGQITGSIQAAQIAGVNASVIVGKLQADQIQFVSAGAIQGLIEANQIHEVRANQINGTISAGQIGSITAGQITGTLAYNQIGSINAATITVNQVQDSQIGSLHGGKIIAGTVTTSRLDANQIDIGQPVGGGPARLRVIWENTVVAQFGYLGEVGAVALGGWVKMLGAGGTSYADAPLYTDSAGSLFIRSPAMSNASLSNPSLNISGQIYTSPTTFDQTYSSLAWINTTGADQTSFVSRGLVLYYNGGKIGAVVRSPGGGWMEIECGVGGSYVLISGRDAIRSDGGYKVGGSIVINTAGQFTGTVIGTLTGTCTGTLTGTAQGPVSTNSSIFTQSTCQAQGGFFGGSFQGSSVSVGGSCSASGGYFGGSFQGAGVSVGANGISCGFLQVTNGSITCGSITVNGAVNCQQLQINGTQRIDGSGIYRGGLQWPDHVYGSDFGIYGRYTGATLNGENSMTFQATNGVQYTFRVVGGLICN